MSLLQILDEFILFDDMSQGLDHATLQGTEEGSCLQVLLMYSPLPRCTCKSLYFARNTQWCAASAMSGGGTALPYATKTDLNSAKFNAVMHSACLARLI